MAQNDDLIKGLTSIYKFVFANSPIHRNIIRKKMLQKGSVASKEKFSRILDMLIQSKRLVMTKEMVSINPEIIQIGAILKTRMGCYIIRPDSKKFKINPEMADAYKSGDLVEYVAESSSEGKTSIILGKSKHEKMENATEDKKPKEVDETDVKDEVQSYKTAPLHPKGNLVLGRVVKINQDNLVFIPNKKSFAIRQIPILNPPEDYANFLDKICIMDMVDLDVPLLGGRIVEVKGDAGNPIHEYDAIAENYGAIMSWEGKQIEEEIAKIPTSVDVESLDLISEAEGRISNRGKVVDLRHIPFVAVDPATCKDRDDAIYSTIDANGDIVCYTAVANVTKYVKLSSEIGRRYVDGAFTIYAPNKAYNILPSRLSTGICSLNANEDRLAFVVKTVIDRNTGKVKASNIYDSLIRCSNCYSYEQAQGVVDEYDTEENKGIVIEKAYTGENLSPEEQILMNYYAGQIIKKGFEQRRMIRFVSNNEREIVFDDGMQDVVDILPIPHLYYHEVIEAFMVTANETTAKYAKDNNLDNVYRVHESPNPHKVDRASEFFNILGIAFDGDLSAEGTRNLIELIRDTANEDIINKFLIKMQSRAVYSDHLYSDKKSDEQREEWMGQRISHYALQSPHYSHTTSPIRRLPDYITQFNILAHMHGTAPISKERIEAIIEIANSRQLDVDQAEKDFEDISSVMYCEKHIGEKMSGRVTKIRRASPEEGYEDNIVVIVKNDDKGINVEIPLSQIIGRSCMDCEISEQHCAVYDRRGNTILTICKPIDFIIEKADRKAMIVVGRTNKQLISSAEVKAEISRQLHSYPRQVGDGKRVSKGKRRERINSKKEHSYNNDDDSSENIK